MADNGAPLSNGRIEFSATANPYAFYNETTNPNDNYFSESTKHSLYGTPVSSVFFSKKNIDFLQEAIRYQVYVQSNQRHIISRQSDTELHIIMRAMYLQYSKNIPFDIPGQVKVLNKMVLDYSVPLILQELRQYEFYKADAGKLPVPMERAQSVSNAGTKFLYTKEL